MRLAVGLVAIGLIAVLPGCTSSAGGGGMASGGQPSVGGSGGVAAGGSGGAIGSGGETVRGSGGTAVSATGGSVAAGGATATGGRGGTSGTGGAGGRVGGTGSGGITATGGAGGGATSPGSGGAPSGSGGAPAGGAGGSVPVATTDYMARKWARWPIPNPPALGLPHPMAYTDGSDGVTDTVTGLVWEKSTNSATTTWQDALAHCQSLGDGWSLPTRIELTSILDNTLSGAKSATVFKYGNKAGWTWASTPWVVNGRKNLTGDAALSWFINFSQGDSNNSLSQTAASAYARCVKVPATQTLPAQHYTIDAGEVSDNYTGLTWQQGDSGATPSLTQDQAVAYCTSLGLNGQVFRLPSLNELASLVDDVPSGNVSPAVDHTAFPGTNANAIYWSASSYGTSTTDFWSLNFEDGFTQHQATSTAGIARCVR